MFSSRSLSLFCSLLLLTACTSLPLDQPIPLPSPTPIDSTPPDPASPLLGVNRSGFEYYCAQYNTGFTDGPTDQASVDAMLSWKINTVRLPLNESCWLGINNPHTQYSGQPYRDFVTKYVNLLNANGIRVVLDLHHAAPGTHLALGQAPAPDLDHAPAFWTSVATLFANRPLVDYDLFNEIYGISSACLINGCLFTDYKGYTPNYGTYQTVGIQSLINTVRATGANNLIIVPSNEWGNDPTACPKLKDPLNNLACDMHVYDGFGKTVAGYLAKFAAYATSTHYPLVLGETGEYSCTTTFTNPIYDYANSHHIGYLAWAWDAWPGKCATGPALISNYDGTPTPYGVGLRSHLLNLAGASKFA